MLLPESVLGWPALILLLGAIAGISVFAGESAGDARRCLSEQRLPPSMVWAGKLGVRLALTVGVALLLLLPALGRMDMVGFRGPGQASTQFSIPGSFLLLGPYLTLP